MDLESVNFNQAQRGFSFAEQVYEHSCEAVPSGLYPPGSLLNIRPIATATTRASASQLFAVNDLQSGQSTTLAGDDIEKACNARFQFATYEVAGMSLTLQFVRDLWLSIGPTLQLNYPVLEENRNGERRQNIDGLRASAPENVCADIVKGLYSSQSTISRILQAQAAAAARRFDSPFPT